VYDAQRTIGIVAEAFERSPLQVLGDMKALDGNRTRPLISYWCRAAAWYVDRILHGAQPAELPVQQPTDYELWVNVQTAQALGVTVPPAIAAQVMEWVQ